MADYKTEVLALSPLLYLRLGEASGTSATDLGSLASNGTYAGTYTQGVTTDIGDADTATTFAYNGGTNPGNLTVPHNTALNLGSGSGNAWSIVFRIRVDGASSGFPGIMTKGGGNAGWLLYHSATGTNRNLSFKVGGTQVNKTSMLTVGTWYHIAVTYDGATITWYKDGVSTGTSALSAAFTSSDTGTLYLNKGDSSNYGSSTLDEVAIFDTTLTSTQISTLYSSWTTAPSSGPNTGTSTGGYDFAGSAVGEGPPNVGATAGGYDFTGSATGSAAHNGTTTGAYDASGVSVAGSRPSLGTTSGAFDFTGSTAGSVAHQGLTTGGYDLTGSATGATPGAINSGAATGSYAYAAVTEGLSAPRSDWSDSASATTDASGPSFGIATGAYAFAGVSLGSRTGLGAAAGDYLLAGSAAGDAALEGAAAGTLNFAGTAFGSIILGNGDATGTFSWFGFATGSAPDVPVHEGVASGSFTFALALAAGEIEHRGLVLSWCNFVGSAVGEGIDPTYTFEPPSYSKALEPPLLTKRPRMGLTDSISVVRVNGTLTPIKGPSIEQLQAAGVEGEDYFLGGHVYTAVPQAVGLELQAAGYTVTEN